MQSSLDSDFEVIKPQMMFNEGLLVHLQCPFRGKNKLLYPSK